MKKILIMIFLIIGNQSLMAMEGASPIAINGDEKSSPGVVGKAWGWVSAPFCRSSQTLLPSSVEPDESDQESISLLVLSAERLYEELDALVTIHNVILEAAIKFILEQKVDLNYVDQATGQTALHKAVINKNDKVVEILVRAHAGWRKRDVAGKTALAYAREKKYDNILSIMLHGGVDE